MRLFLAVVFILYTSSFALAASKSVPSAELGKDTVYVIEVLKTSNYKEIQQTREKLKSINSNKAVFAEFKSPNHHLLVGYFNTLKEAEEFQQLIKDEFPGSIILPRVP